MRDQTLQTPGSQQLAIFDGSLANLDQLIAGLAPGVAHVVIDPASDGFAQLEQALGGSSGLASISIFSHGAPGGIRLGSAVLNAASLQQYSAMLANIGHALADGGDLLLYGCDVAQSAAGQAFIADLARLTGADVAASLDLTGATALGGNWQLEAATGMVTPLAVQGLAQYQGVLVNAAPVLATSGSTPSFTEQNVVNPVSTYIDQAITVTDDGATLASATVAITGNFQQYNDMLRLIYNGADYGNISANYSSTTGVMTMTSNGATATLAQWQNALRNIGYASYSDYPTTAPRTISFTVNDGLADSTAVTKSITVNNVNDAPALLGGDGTTQTLNYIYGRATGLALQSDGKILAIGEGTQLGIVRYLANGKFDTGFGTNNKVTLSYGTDFLNYSKLVVQADGKIVVGANDNGNVFLARLNADGSADASFDGDGKLVADISGGFETLSDIRVQSDGKIVAAGYTSNQFVVARFNTDGTLDTGFNSTGKVMTSFSNVSYAPVGAVAIQADGKIIVAGDTNGLSTLVRYNTDGTLDTSFDSDGIATGTLGMSFSSSTKAMKIQADGKIVVAGGTWDGSQWIFGLARYNTNGTLDTSFGTLGKTSAKLANGEDFIYQLQILSDGKLLVGGSSANGGDRNLAVARFNSDGTPDMSFSGDGNVTKDMGSHGDSVQSMVVQADGAIVVGGNTGSYQMELARFTASGELDTSFNQVTYPISGAPIIIRPTAQVSDPEVNPGANGATNFAGGSLTIARHGGANAQDQFSAAPNNVLAPLVNGGNFTVGGVTIGTVTLGSGSLSVAFNASATVPLLNQALRLLAYSNSSGTPPSSVQLDWTFNDGNSGLQGSGGALSTINSTTIKLAANTAPVLSGTATTPVFTEQPYSYNSGTRLDPGFAISDDGGTFASATIKFTSSFTPYMDTLMLQINGDAGNITSSYDSFNGILTLTSANASANQIQWETALRSVAFNSNGDAPVTGTRTVSVTLNDGMLNSNTVVKTVTVNAVNDAPALIGGDGIATSLGGEGSVTGLALQGDGKILAASGTSAGSIGVIRYLANGRIDTAFGTGGKASLAMEGIYPNNNKVLLQADGKIIVGGAFNNTLVLARFNSNGTADSSFDSDGKLQTAPNSSGYMNDLLLQSDGKIVALTYSYNSGFTLSLTRFNSDGSLDTTFDGDGKATYEANSSGGTFAYGLAQQADGKLVIAGYMWNGSAQVLQLWRYNTNGSLDTSFDGDGILNTAYGSANSALGQSVKVQADGKLLIGGNAWDGSHWNFAIKRLNSDGSTDTSFGTAGTVLTSIASSNANVRSMAVQTDGKIVLSGSMTKDGTNDSDLVVIRYNSNGTLDTTFSGDGIQVKGLGSNYENPNALLVQPDGKIVQAGYTGGYHMEVLRYLADGSPDISFHATTYAKGGAPVRINDGLTLMDPDVNSLNYAVNNFAGGFLHIERNGGRSAQDEFSALSGGTLSALVAGGNVVVDGTTIGTVASEAAGGLTLQFNTNANTYLINQAISQIAYRNTSGTPPASVQLNWTFNDGNTGAQGSGGALQGTATTTIIIGEGGAATAANRDFNGDGKSDIMLRHSSGQLYLYQMNGTSIASQAALITVGSEWKVVGEGDANGDGKSDLLLRNSNTGQLYSYLMNSNAIIGQGAIDTLPGWTVAGNADFNGDGKADILLRNASNGQLYTYLMNGTSVTGQGLVDTLPAWTVAATGDYNGDGKADILLRNASNGQLYQYRMNGATIAGQGLVDSLPGWTVAASGDYNGDGKADILLRNSTTGMVYTYLMNGNTIIGQGAVDTLAATWKIADGVADYNGDGKSDILLRNDSGQLYTYLMNGTAIAAQGTVSNPGTAWNLADAAVANNTPKTVNDFNGDGKSDILLRNPATGQLYEYQMNGAAIAGQGMVDTLPGWLTAGTGDYNGDGKADILLRNTSNGQLYAYLMNGNAVIGQGVIDTLPGWQVAGSGDFNGDGKSDILLRNIASGQLYEYQMNGAAIAGQGLVDTLPGWQVAGTGDFNGDGKTDLLLRNMASGQLYEYMMNGAAITGQGLVDTLPGWQVAGTGDYNGDGKADILLRNPTSGQLYEYRMNGAAIIGQGLVDTLPVSWQVADGNSDFNGDGKADLLLRNTASGQLYEYLMNGNTIIGQGLVDTLPGWTVAQEHKVIAFTSTTTQTINGFATGLDKIVLKQAVFSAMPAGALATGSFVSGSGAVALDANDYIIYDTSNGKLYYDADGSGAGVKVQIATLTGQPPLVANDVMIQP